MCYAFLLGMYGCFLKKKEKKSYLSTRRLQAGSMEKHLDSMVMVARGVSRNARIVRMYPLTVLFTFTMVIIINSILGLINNK